MDNLTSGEYSFTFATEDHWYSFQITFKVDSSGNAFYDKIVFR